MRVRVCVSVRVRVRLRACACVCITNRHQDLQCRAQHLDVLVVKETPRNGDDMVVVRGEVGVEHRRYQATRPMLHPPRAME